LGEQKVLMKSKKSLKKAIHYRFWWAVFLTSNKMNLAGKCEKIVL